MATTTDQRNIVASHLKAAHYGLWAAYVQASTLNDTELAGDICDLLPEVDRILMALQPWRRP